VRTLEVRVHLRPEGLHDFSGVRGSRSDTWPDSPWWKSGVAPRRARRPAGKARRPRIPAVF